MSSSNQKRCSSGQTTTSKASTSLSRSKTCAFTGASALKTKAERLRPLPSNRSSTLNDENVLDDLNNLHPAMVQELVLHARGLQTIPNLSQFSKLQILDLSCNSLTRIDNLKSLTNLRELKLYGNQIEKVENLECLTQLQILQLQYNEIQSIGFALGYLTRLQTLRIDSNPLSSIRSEEVQKLVQMKSLDVSDSSLNNLDFINVLGALTEVRAAHCHLKTLPSFGRSLRNLIDLDLSNNELRQISALKSLSSLRVLHLANNQIQDVQILSHLVHLNELDLSNNQITSLPNSFEKLIDLQSLHLAHNRIQSWSDIDVLRRLNSLFILTIEGNPLTEDTENYLEKLTKLSPSLEVIDDISLQNNQSKILPDESSEQMMNIDKELKEVDQTLERSIAAVQAQFDSIAGELHRLQQLTKAGNHDQGISSPRTTPTNQKSKHRLFQALAFSEENYVKEDSGSTSSS